MKKVLCYTGFILCLLVCNNQLFAQRTDILDLNVKVTIKEGDLKSIFQNLEANNPIVVSYSSSIVDLSIEKYIDTTVYVCSDLFSYLLEEQAVRAISRGKKILIIPDPSKSISFSRLRPRNYYTVNGYVKDAETGEALIGASIYNPLTNRGTITNEFGYYSLTMPEGRQTVNYSFVGFNAVSETFSLNKRIRSDVFLKSNIEMEEILVIDQDSSQIWRGREKISIDEIYNLPAIFGEVDVIKSIGLLPGVQSGNEGQGGLLVRGGSPDQNLIMVDGMPLYEVNHLLGLVSIFNEDVINNVNLYKGDFSAKYGGRLSSVVDIQLKDGNYKNFHGGVTTGLLGGKFNLEGPIQREKSSFALAGRTSWLNRTVVPIVDNYLEIDQTNLKYYDYNIKIKRDFKSTNSLTFSAYSGRDFIRYSDLPQRSGKFNLNTLNHLSWGNDLASLRWSRHFSSKTFSNLTAGFVNYNYLYHVRHNVKEIDSDLEETFTVASASRIFDRMLKWDFDYFMSNKLDIKFGAGMIMHTYNPAIKQTSMEEENNINAIFGDIIPINASEYYFYGENYFRPFSNLSIHTGFHYAMFTVKGKFYDSFQPRISVNYGLPWHSYVGASYSRMNQFVHLLANPGIGLPNDLWVPSTDNLAPEISDQFTFSYNLDISKSYKLHSGIYYKTFQNLLEYRSAYDLFTPVITDLTNIPDFSLSRDWESRVESGNGLAYGFELQIKKKEGNPTGAISYTYGRSFRIFEDVNRSIPFPYRYDRKHDVSASLIYKFSEQFNLGMLWIYGTGNAYTVPLDEYYSHNGELILDYETRNNQRLPDYHRFDFSLNYENRFNRYHVHATLGAYNAYNRQNPYYVYLFQNPETQSFQLRQISIFPILPYINVKLKL